MKECFILCCLVSLSIISICHSFLARIFLILDFLAELDFPPLASPLTITLISYIAPSGSSFFSSWGISMDVLPSDCGSSCHKHLQLPSLNEGFYLLLQIESIIGILTMVLMKATVLVPISPFGWGSDLLRLLDARLVLNMHE